MRWALFAPVAVLTLFVGYLALQLGRVPTETQIITDYAARYVATAGAGARMTDCAAAPHPAARMIVICRHDSGVRYRYVVGNRGQLIRDTGPAA